MQLEYALRSGLSGLFDSATSWIAVAYVVCMFLVVAFRPQQIGSPSTFRLSYLLFLLFFIVPSAINGILSLLMLVSGPHGGGGGQTGDQFALMVVQLSALLGKVLLGLSIFFGLASLRIQPPSQFPPVN